MGYAGWERAGWGSEHLRDLASNVAFLPLNLGVVVLNVLAARQPLLDPGVRKALRLIALAFFAVFLGNIVNAFYVVQGESPPVSAADYFYLLNSPILLTALLGFPLARRTRHERAQLVLDGAVVLLGTAVMLWYFIVLPSAASGAKSSVLVQVNAYAYPLGTMLVLYGLTTVLLRKPTDANRLAFGLLVTGVGVSLIADLAFNFVLLETEHRGMAWTDSIYLATYLCLIASAERYWRRPVPALIAERVSDPVPGPVSPLPYLAVAVTYAIVTAVALRDWVSPLSNLALATVAMTALIVTRQFLAVRQNARLLSEAAERRTEARFRSLVQHSSDVILVATREGLLRYVSPAASQVFGYDPARALGRSVTDFVHPQDADRVRSFLRDAAQSPGSSSPVEWRMSHPDGSWFHTETVASNLLGDGVVDGIVLNTRDVSERKRLERQLTHQAFHDSLTGLANRALFRDRVGHALMLARRQKRTLSVIYLDLDDFKKVNDSLGHAMGDQLLVQAAERLRSCARTTDTVARLGGDEFAILVEALATSDACEIVLERLSTAMARPFTLGDNELVMRASIGIAASGGEEGADDLLRNADMAMYAAKRRGKGRQERYDARLHAEAIAALETEAALRGAVDRGELVLHYQPIVSLRDGKLFGVEALIRWDHPKEGLLLPGAFVPLAEENGLIIPLSRWVLTEAFRQCRRWRSAYPELDLAIAVNISGRQLQVPTLGAELRGALEASGAEPSAIVFEITESILMQQTEATLHELQDIKGTGVRIAIDDFGTGYSSLGYLQRFPIDILKIAKPFVEHVGVGAGLERAALARAIVGLGETLRLRTVAEGIEVPAQRAGLVELGCELGQGYLFAPPMPSASIERLLAGDFPWPESAEYGAAATSG
jgi:diguanylate cyclase (GGDEF)-like protein/PAS domain S-box-containing protein